MPSFFEPAARDALVARLNRLTPEARAAWGRMNVGQMVCHLSEAMRMTLGEVTCKPRGGPLSFPPLRWLIIHKLPFPKGAPTAPELLAGVPAAALEDDKAALRGLLARVAERGEAADYPPHPAFGKLTGRDVGVLIYRHMDHHLRQFGA